MHENPRHPSPPLVPEAVCQMLRVEVVGLYGQLRAAKDPATIAALLKQIAVVNMALQHCPEILPPPPSPYPDLAAWLTQHPTVASSVVWQFQAANPQNAYAPPASTDKVAWPNWTSTQQAELNQVYLDSCAWLDAGAHQVQVDPYGLTDAPTNVHPNVGDDLVTVMEWVPSDYMWKLFIGHVGFSLALELTQRLPWSIAGYGPIALRYLFDSATMAWNITGLLGQHYGMGTYAAYVPALRADNLPKTPFASPRWTYPFLTASGLIGSTKLATIGRVLEWMRRNMWHFFGQDTFGNCFGIWQYRGYPPLSRIVNGTVDTNHQTYGLQHWTMGCHGSVGFLNAMLRVVNAPCSRSGFPATSSRISSPSSSTLTTATIPTI